jgi:hypothetical protein
MDALEFALKNGEEPPKMRIVEIIKRTMRIDIPVRVRKYLIDIMDEKAIRKVGNPSKSVLDQFFQSATDMFFDRTAALKSKYDELRSDGYKEQDALEKIALECRGWFRGRKAPANDTLAKIIYSK